MKPIVVRPPARAACNAAITLGERPEDPDEDIVLAAEPAHLPLEHPLEPVVVADRSEHRAVGRERDRGQGVAIEREARQKLSGDVLGVGGAAAVAGDQQLAAVAVGGGDRRADRRQSRQERRVGRSAIQRLARAAQVKADRGFAELSHCICAPCGGPW